MKDGNFIQLWMDSRTTVAFINHQGSMCSQILYSMAKELWGMVTAWGNWIKAFWLPRDDNQVSNILSKGNLLT